MTPSGSSLTAGLPTAGPGAGGWRPAPRGWTASVLGGALPLLLLGFAASAVANRVVFAGWALLAAVGHVVSLRQSWQAGLCSRGRGAACVAWSAVVVAVFAHLVHVHTTALDLGYRAVLWEAYLPVLTRADTWWAAAGSLAVVAGGLASLAARGRR